MSLLKIVADLSNFQISFLISPQKCEFAQYPQSTKEHTNATEPHVPPTCPPFTLATRYSGDREPPRVQFSSALWPRNSTSRKQPLTTPSRSLWQEEHTRLDRSLLSHEQSSTDYFLPTTSWKRSSTSLCFHNSRKTESRWVNTSQRNLPGSGFLPSEFHLRFCTDEDEKPAEYLFLFCSVSEQNYRQGRTIVEAVLCDAKQTPLIIGSRVTHAIP